MSTNVRRLRPLFLQTGFRTGGTWLWSRFRKQSTVMAFCEPFNEALAHLTADEIGSVTALNSALNHPALDAPYFHEYLGLLEEKRPGVRGFHPRFGVESYFGNRTVRNDDVRAYLQSLIDYAASQDKIALLKFTRALGRSAWLREQFPDSGQLLLIRHPLTQFWSGYAQATRHKNFTFLMIPIFALSRANSRAARAIIEKFKIPYSPSTMGSMACIEEYTALARQMPIEQLFCIFLAWYVLSYALSVPHADLIVLQERMQTQASYRHWVEEQAAMLFGLPVDLSDIKTDAAEELQAIANDPVMPQLVGCAEDVLKILSEDYPDSVEFVRNSLAGRMNVSDDAGIQLSPKRNYDLMQPSNNIDLKTGSNAPSKSPPRRRPYIVQVTPTSYARDGIIGGGERIALYIDQALRSAAESAGVAVDTTVLSLDAPEALGHGLDRYQAVPGSAWNPRSVAAQDLIDRLKRADVVYVHQCLTEIGLFAAAHARLLGKRVYGSDAGAGEAQFLHYNPEATLIYDAVHAISAFAASAFRGFPIPVHVVPGPVDTDIHVPPPPHALARNPNLVLSVGRVLPHKGYERTIRALPASMSLIIVGQHYDADYFAFLKSCAEGKDVQFLDDLDDTDVRKLLHSAGTFVHASTHYDYAGRFYHKPELLGLAPLEALASGQITLVSDAGSLPELGELPGCHVFRSDTQLAALLHEAASGRLPQVEPAAMHDAVVAGYGLATVGTKLLQMMKVLAPCASSY